MSHDLEEDQDQDASAQCDPVLGLHDVGVEGQEVTPVSSVLHGLVNPLAALNAP